MAVDATDHKIHVGNHAGPFVSLIDGPSMTVPGLLNLNGYVANAVAWSAADTTLYVAGQRISDGAGVIQVNRFSSSCLGNVCQTNIAVPDLPSALAVRSSLVIVAFEGGGIGTVFGTNFAMPLPIGSIPGPVRGLAVGNISAGNRLYVTSLAGFAKVLNATTYQTISTISLGSAVRDRGQ